MKEKFQSVPLRTGTLERIDTANAIIAEYYAKGYRLTLRQLYYQFVARGLIENDHREYKKLGDTLSKARLAGLVDWGALEDRTRFLRGYWDYSDEESLIASAVDGLYLDPWERQEYAPEVWIEKDALIGVIERVCTDKRVQFFACRGYTSQSAQYDAGKRMAQYQMWGKRPIVFHLGDHDPSGIDMTRDNTDRLSMFARMGVEVRRLALNMDQVEQYDPPPNPVKEKDSRQGAYQEEYGGDCWELDALDPDVIAGLVSSALDDIIDPDAWQASMDEEERKRRDFARFSDNFWNIKEFLDDNYPVED